MQQLLGICVKLLANAKRPSLKGPVPVGEMQEEGKVEPIFPLGNGLS